jgi:predicted nucleotidyltransferase
MDINVPKIDTIISIIVSIASPDQIILFGSYARGDNTDKSDIDLFAIDYDRYLKLSDEIGYVYKTIKKEGKVIYDSL